MVGVICLIYVRPATTGQWNFFLKAQGDDVQPQRDGPILKAQSTPGRREVKTFV